MAQNQYVFGDKMGDQPIQRKLAAILYADVAGYSRLTGADEVGTHEALRTGLAMLTKSIESHGGRINHYAGDATQAGRGTSGRPIACRIL